ncbi:MAG TPA: ABC transporter permease [Ktedonobacterales bacterium]
MRQFYVLFKANLLSTMRNRSAVFFNIFSPVLFFVIFGFIFKNDTGSFGAGGPTIGYAIYLLAGIIVMSQLASGFYGGAAVLVTWRERGIFRRIQATPMSVWQLMLARVLAQLIVIMLQAGVIILTGKLVFDVLPAKAGALWDVLFIVAGGLVFLAIGQLIAARVKRVETANILINVIWLPLLFFTDLFFPLSQLPDALQQIGKVLPPYLVVELLRSSIILGQPPEHALADVVGLALYFVLAVVISARIFSFE